MAYELLWLGTLATILAWTAALTATAARRRSRWAQVSLAVGAGLLLPALVGAAATAGTGFLKFVENVEPNWFYYCLSWTVAVATAGSVVLVRGLRRCDGAEPAPAARQWRSGRLLAICGVGCLLVCLTFLAMDMAVRAQVASLQSEINALAAAARGSRPPDRENAALVYERAFEALRAGDAGGDEEWTKALERWPADATIQADDAGLTAFLERSAGGLGLLRQAADMPECFFDHHIEPPSVLFVLPELRRLRSSSKLLRLDARFRLAKGLPTAALADVAAMYGLSDHVGRGPYVLSFLASVAVDAEANRVLAEVLSAGRIEPAALAALKARRSRPVRHRLRHALMMERCLNLSMLTGLYGGGSAAMGGQPSLRPPGLGAEYRVFWLPGELESCARLMNRHMRRLHEPPHGDGLVLAREAGPPRQDEPMGPMTKLLMPALDRVFELAAAAEAHERLARLAIAAAEHRAATGRWPTRAADIVPKYTPYLPLDPFTRKPLKMKAEGGDVIFYSVGNNRTDDGGARGKGIDEGDIVIHLSGSAGRAAAAGIR